MVDVTPHFERKIAALEVHANQLAQILGDLRELVADRLRAVGAPHGIAYAESFRVVKRRR